MRANINHCTDQISNKISSLALYRESPLILNQTELHQFDIKHRLYNIYLLLVNLRFNPVNDCKIFEQPVSCHSADEQCGLVIEP